MKNSLSALDFFSAKLAYEIPPEDLALIFRRAVSGRCDGLRITVWD